MDITQFFVWLASASGATAFLSFVAERIPAFQKLTSAEKGYVMLGGSLAVSLAAFAVLTYTPADVLAQLAPWFQVAYGVVVAWMANQFAHKQDPLA